MEAAVRHAALRDPTAPASPWTMQKPWMCVSSCACLETSEVDALDTTCVEGRLIPRR